MIVGLIAPDAGSVAVGGADPLRPETRRRIGICPQSVSLYPELTGRQNLTFFARLQGLSGRDLRARVDWALDFSGLTDRADTRVSTYSGGMQRRLNLAAGMVHDPEVLLCDEPTVGVDPQSRNHLYESIERLRDEGRPSSTRRTTWKRRSGCATGSRSSTTEQCSPWDRPTELIAAHGGTATVTAELSGPRPAGLDLPGSLDGPSLRFESNAPLAEVARLVERGFASTRSVSSSPISRVCSSRSLGGACATTEEEEEGANLRNALVMAMKDLHLLWRDKFALFWVAAFPSMMALFVGATGGSGPPPVWGSPVVDLDDADASRAFVASRPFRRQRLARPGDGVAVHAASRHAMAWPPTMSPPISWFRRVPRGGRTAVRQPGPPSRWGSTRRAAPKPAISRASWSGPRSSASARRSQLRELRAGASRPSPVVRSARRPPNAWAISFPQAMSWGVIGCCASFAVGLVQERARGTYGRLRMAPNPAWTILAGKAIACFTACFGSSLFLVLFGMIFGVRVGSWPALFAALVSLSFGFTGFMMLISTLGRTEQAVSGAGGRR